MEGFEYQFCRYQLSSGRWMLGIVFENPRLHNLSAFISTDSKKLDVINGRVEDIRRVLEGEIEVWESGGDASQWTIRQNVTEIASEFEIFADETFDPGPRVLIPTQYLEELILSWRREEAALIAEHPPPARPSRFHSWRIRRAMRRQRDNES